MRPPPRNTIVQGLPCAKIAETVSVSQIFTPDFFLPLVGVGIGGAIGSVSCGEEAVKYNKTQQRL